MWLIQTRLRARRHPRATAFFVLGGFIVFLTAPYLYYGTTDLTSGSGSFDFETLIGGLPWQFALSAVLLGIVWFLAWWDVCRLSSRIDHKGLGPLIMVLVFPVSGTIVMTSLMTDAPGGRSPQEVLFIIIALNILVGFSEEVIFRGILFGALRQKNRLMTAIMVSSIAFGVMHFVNTGLGQNIPQTLFQMLNATALGVLFCGLVLQGNSLWPAIILHMIWNTFAMMGVASAEMTVDNATGPTQDASFTAWGLMLPSIILFIAVTVLAHYRLRTGTKLLDVVPISN